MTALEDKLAEAMTLRDYFAGQVLCGWAITGNPRFDPKDDAEWCYKLADAMLKERARAKGGDR